MHPFLHKMRRLHVLGGVGAALLLAAGVVIASRAGAPPGSADDLFAGLTRGGFRRLEGRLSHPAADRHRPFRAGRPAAPALLLSGKLLLERERAGDVRGLAAAYALAGLRGQAQAQLTRVGPGPAAADAASDRAALLLAEGAEPEDVLAAVDRALPSRPGHPQAHWNRALALERLGLSLGAADDFRAVAARGEPGWSDEARRRADDLTARHRAARDSWRRATEAGRRLAQRRELPPPEVVRDYPDLARSNLYEAVRSAASPKELVTLRPLARLLDELQGDNVLSEHLRQVAALDFDRRRPCADAYRPLIPLEALAEPELQRVLRKLSAPACADIRFGALRLAPSRQDYAQQRARHVRASGDPWLSVSDDYFQARTLYAANQYEHVRRNLETSIARCEQVGARLPCIEQRVLLTFTHLVQHRIQDTRAAALAALQAMRRWGLFGWEGWVYALLGQMENSRDVFAPARAYLNEVVLLGEPCPSVRGARQVLADIALDEIDLDRAWRLLSEVPDCRDGLPRYELTGAKVLAELARRPGNPYPAALELVRQSLAGYRSSPGRLGPATRALASTIEGSALLAREPQAARTILREAIAAAEAVAGENADAAKARDLAYLALVAEAGARSAHDDVLDLLAELQRLPSGQDCTLAVALDFPRLIVAARAHGSQRTGVFQEVGPAFEYRDAVPRSVQRFLAACPVLRVLATPPIRGTARLLPDEMAWFYVSSEGAPPARTLPARRLVVSGVDAPDDLGLPRLSTAPASADETPTTHLTGGAATAERVLQELPAHDEIQLHVHGIVDRKLSDAAALVLAPGAQGTAFLTVEQITKTRLPRRPLVVLGACLGGRAPRYGPLSWSLPWAFIRAGAGVVLASPEPVEDLEAHTFFSWVVDRIRRGTAPAVAVRDARLGGATGRPGEWAAQVVVFN